MADGTEVVAPSTPTLGQEIAEMMGDRGHTEESPDESSTAPASAPVETDAGSTGTETEAERGEAPSQAATTDVTSTTDASTDDPLKGATPITYTVDGQSRTWDKIQVLGEAGAVIQADDIPDVMRRLGERDHLFEANRELYQQSKTVEPYATWKQTGADGKEETLTGAKALEAVHVDHARLSAIVGAFEALFADPKQLRGLLTLDEAKNVVFEPQAFENLLLRAERQAVTAMDQRRASLGQAVTQASKPAEPTVDFAEKGPAFIKTLAGADAAKLTPEDVRKLTTQLPFYHIKGTTTVDPTFQELVKDTIASRQQLATVATTATDAAKQNAARLAAASRGGKPAKAPAKPTAQRDAQAAERAKTRDASNFWDQREAAAASALRVTP